MKDNLSLISVIMSVYNEKIDYLTKSIDSILNQTYRNFEFIIIGDGTNKENIKLIKSYSKKDHRIKFIISNKNLGPASSRNIGIKIAIGKYIAIMDSDDISESDRLLREINYLETHKNIFLIGSSTYSIDENDKIIYKNIVITGSRKIKNRLIHENCIYHPTVMFRNDKNTFYRGKMFYTEDYDLYLRLLTKNKKLNNFKEPLLYYRVNKNSVSNKNKYKQKIFSDIAKQYYFMRLKNNKDSYDIDNFSNILKIDNKLEDEKLTLKKNLVNCFNNRDFKNFKIYYYQYKIKFKVESSILIMKYLINIPFSSYIIKKLREYIYFS